MLVRTARARNNVSSLDNNQDLLAWAASAFSLPIAVAKRSTSAAIPGSRGVAAERPCRRALRPTFSLPATERGPELRCALRLLAAILASSSTRTVQDQRWRH